MARDSVDAATLKGKDPRGVVALFGLDGYTDQE
jgi:hypothetical protein